MMYIEQYIEATNSLKRNRIITGGRKTMRFVLEWVMFAHPQPPYSPPKHSRNMADEIMASLKNISLQTAALVSVRGRIE